MLRLYGAVGSKAMLSTWKTNASATSCSSAAASWPANWLWVVLSETMICLFSFTSALKHSLVLKLPKSSFESGAHSFLPRHGGWENIFGPHKLSFPNRGWVYIHCKRKVHVYCHPRTMISMVFWPNSIMAIFLDPLGLLLLLRTYLYIAGAFGLYVPELKFRVVSSGA